MVALVVDVGFEPRRDVLEVALFHLCLPVSDVVADFCVELSVVYVAEGVAGEVAEEST